MTPDVSVIMASYNSALFLEEAVGSVLGQSFQNWELIISDDASDDDTVAIARRFSAQDSRIRLMTSDVNQGAAVTRNKAIEAAKGRFIAFLDSDDVWLPEKLERQIPFMKENGFALTHTGYRKISESGQDLQRDVVSPDALSYEMLLKSNAIGCLTAVYDSKILGKIYMPLIRKRQDYGLWLSILRQGHMAYSLPDILALYRVRTGSISSNKIEMLHYNWRLYRNIERLPVHKAAYYLGWNVLKKLTG